MIEGYDPSKCQHLFLEKTLEKMRCSDEVAYLLQTPQREVSFEIPIRLQNGDLKVFKAFRVQHNDSRGPFKGGLRYHPSVDLPHCRALAFLMTWKTSLLNLPFGGAKGGISCDPADLKRIEREILTKQYCVRMDSLMGPDFDILAPDAGTSQGEMAWLFQAYSRRDGYKPGVVTGKPVNLGGIEGRTEATGLGVATIAALAASAHGIPLETARIAVQGFGNVGSHVAKFLFEKGARIVAVSDVTGTIFNGDGLDIETLFKETVIEGSISSLSFSQIQKEILPRDAIFDIESDILIPAALEAAVSSENAGSIKTKMVVEAANIPVTNNGDKILVERGIPVIPDILANAGGVVVSYLEWASNHQRFAYPKSKVAEFLIQNLNSAWLEVYGTSETENLSYRDASYLISVNRVCKAMEMRGFF